jgi:serine O-acetyltransferase
MTKPLNILTLGRDGLVAFTTRQLANLLPDGREEQARVLIEQYIDQALSRLHVCINAVKTWTPDAFNYLHSSQYCTYLYYLSNTVWRETGTTEVPTKLFLLNKALNGIDLFYEIHMPEIFFIGHSTGIVFAKATYSNYLVVYQNSTVGKNHGIAPVLDEGVILYPNSAVIGSCHIGKEALIAQGVGVISTDVAAGCMVFAGEGGLIQKPSKRRIIEDFFRFS